MSNKGKVVLAVPTITRPFQQCIDSMEASIAAIKGAGWTLGVVTEISNPYISCARATMLRKAMDAKADVVVFIDHDLSWEPHALLQLIETPGDVIAGTYRFKRAEEEYMGALLPDIHGRPQVRDDGCVKAHSVPAGFLKITANGVNRFMLEYPELCYGDRFSLAIDLFNHGAHEGRWYGEDYAFSRRWNAKCGQIWIIPDLNLTHWSRAERMDGEYNSYPGNFHKYLLRQDEGSESENPVAPEKAAPVVVPQHFLSAA
jgi:glycosyltransferase involved in cell wall biosynthesis